jgi:enoyl-[acyl-carrier protein] reductase I
VRGDLLLEGKAGVVFGVANKFSIAWAVAEAAARHGAKVAIGYQDERMLDSVLGLTEGNDSFRVYECDLNRDEQLAQLSDSLQRDYGGLDFIVHSVAYARREDMAGRFLDCSRDGFKVALETSCFTFVACCRALEGLLRDGGSCLTMSYLGSSRVVPIYGIMGIAKAALESSTRYLAYDFGPRGIRVNALSPGPISTVAARSIPGFSKMTSEAKERVPLSTPVAQPEVADAALFLLSDLSRGITGEVIFVDGGYHMV